MPIRNYRYILAVACMSAIALFMMAPVYDSGLLNFASMIFFSKVCHQETARSILINGATPAVCARCMGIYLGAWLGVILSPTIWSKWSNNKAIFLMFAPMCIDGPINFLFTTPGIVRMMTGVLAGFAAAAIALPAFIEEIPWSRLKSARRDA